MNGIGDLRIIYWECHKSLMALFNEWYSSNKNYLLYHIESSDLSLRARISRFLGREAVSEERLLKKEQRLASPMKFGELSSPATIIKRRLMSYYCATVLRLPTNAGPG
jgi:hypothetical protein